MKVVPTAIPSIPFLVHTPHQDIYFGAEVQVRFFRAELYRISRPGDKYTSLSATKQQRRLKPQNRRILEEWGWIVRMYSEHSESLCGQQSCCREQALQNRGISDICSGFTCVKVIIAFPITAILRGQKCAKSMIKPPLLFRGCGGVLKFLFFLLLL